MSKWHNFLIFAGPLLLAGCEAQEDQDRDQGWVFLFQSENDRTCAFMDKATINENLSYKRAWLRITNPRPSSKYSDVLFEFDCASRRQRTLQTEAYHNSEQVYLEVEQSAWERIDTDQRNMHAFSVICEIKDRSDGVDAVGNIPPNLPPYFCGSPSLIPASDDGSVDCDSVPLPELQRANGWCS